MDEEPVITRPARTLTLVIKSAAEVGFTVEESGHIVAAVATPLELAQYVELRARELAGEEEREAEDHETVVTQFPAIMRAGRWRPFSRGR